ncbi:MAG: excinuclease ABC subunit A, partial [candidate division WS1 bacterium]|nr:excinuclease ABC subunit A [candidate division WS1 bacterium]
EHFSAHPTLTRILQTLIDVGLGYIKLGQPATTLSGGEAQRVKLARELARPRAARSLYLLDEPTVGLHFEDVRRLLEVLQRFVEEGHTVLVIEHHPDLIKAADYLIDLGPEGGEEGGRIVATGTPEELAACPTSHTGALLREVLGGGHRVPAVGKRRRSSRSRTTALAVRGARRHNLQNLTVSLPRRQLVALAGLSGSGKTSLALDTIYAEGQRRFVGSLSPYARQFINQMPKPPVESLTGLSPAVAVESRNAIVTPRSTVGTVTQIYDYLRVLYARVGQQHCPDCQVPLGAASVDEVVDRLTTAYRGRPLILLAPLRPTGSEEYQGRLALAEREGWTRVWVDGEQRRLPLPFAPDRRRHHEVAVIVDRLTPDPRERSRLAEGVEAAFHLTEGQLEARLAEDPLAEPLFFGADLSCPRCGTAYDRLSPRQYSFNHYEGWCDRCYGLGTLGGGWSREEAHTCPDCQGDRLYPASAATLFRDLSLPALSRLPLGESLRFFQGLQLTPAEIARTKDVFGEITRRLGLLMEIGLDYLTLDRSGPTLSGGELQRVNLAGQLGCGLTGLLYVLDEPTVGVHPRDNDLMLAALRRLQSLGNSLLVVEHDLQTLRSADHLVEFGPGAGVAGGRVVAQGTPASVSQGSTLTGQYLSGRLAVPLPADRR